MGTNYYFNEPEAGEQLHIGKSSAGWVFLVHLHRDQGIHNIQDWYEKISSSGGCIENEYGDIYTLEELKDVIENRSWPTPVCNKHTWKQQNDAEPGPNNLARPKIGSFCVRHGVGTWSYCIGEFS